MDELTFITLTIEGIEANNGRHVIKSGGKSYSFFEKKKDGTETKAFQKFKKLNMQVGQSYGFGIKEATSTNQAGQPVTYRNIAVIGPPQDFPQPTQPTQDFITRAEFGELVDRVRKLENQDISPKDILPNQQSTPPDSQGMGYQNEPNNPYP